MRWMDGETLFLEGGLRRRRAGEDLLELLRRGPRRVASLIAPSLVSGRLVLIEIGARETELASADPSYFSD